MYMFLMIKKSQLQRSIAMNYLLNPCFKNKNCNFSDWNKKCQQAQPFINRIHSVMERKTLSYEQIGFLRRCQQEKLTPKGLRVKLLTNMGKMEYYRDTVRNGAEENNW